MWKNPTHIQKSAAMIQRPTLFTIKQLRLRLDIETLDKFVMVVVEREIKLNEMSRGMVENNVFGTGLFIELKKLRVYGLVVKSVIEPSLNR